MKSWQNKGLMADILSPMMQQNCNTSVAGSARARIQKTSTKNLLTNTQSSKMTQN